MFNSTTPKLALRKQSIRTLTKDDLRIAVGGGRSTGKGTTSKWCGSTDCPA